MRLTQPWTWPRWTWHPFFAIRYIVLPFALTVALIWGVPYALAQLIEGTSGPDVLNGTANGDRMYGYGGNDTINGKQGGDLLVGGSGADTIDAGVGYDSVEANGDDDLIYVDATDGKGDVVDCGSGVDIVFWHVPGTVINSNCEHVYLS